MTVSVQKQVLRFQIAVNDVVRVEIIKRKGDLGGVKFRDRIGEALLQSVCCMRVLWEEAYLRFAQQTEQFTTLDEVHDHVEILRVLERSPQSD